MMVARVRNGGTWVFAMRIYLALPPVSKLPSLCGGYANQSLSPPTGRNDLIRSLGSDAQKTKETLERESLLFGSGTWIRTKNNGVRGRYVTLTPFRHCLCARIFYHNGLRLSSIF